MSNSFFHFKQFTVHQEKCAMKVCTDACLFGAWVAQKMEHGPAINHILDIGAGTGLLSLMLAQKSKAAIDTVELDKAAAEQAAENFAASPWGNRLTIHHSGIADFAQDHSYDCIISNPPFFEDDLKSDNESRNKAMHSTTLNLEKLLDEIKKRLSVTGQAAVLIPYKRSGYFEALLAAKGFFVQDVLHVKQSVQHEYFRSQYLFSLQPAQKNSSSLAIQDAQRNYTVDFTALLKDYYLKL
ncbi:MAG: methyltransferase [Ferruginibacter sp.]